MSNNMIRVDSNNHWICVDSNNHWICVDSSKICRIGHPRNESREKKTVGQHFYTGAPASVSPKTPQTTCGLSRNLRRSSSAVATSQEDHRSPRSGRARPPHDRNVVSA
jgi:hypothetical protein